MQQHKDEQWTGGIGEKTCRKSNNQKFKVKSELLSEVASVVNQRV